MVDKISLTVINKPWGHEEIICTNENYTLKKLYILKGHKCSSQYHEEKVETIYMTEGLLKLTYGDEEVILKPGDTIHIPSNTIHRMEGLEDSEFIEVSTSELNDVVRIKDEYGRL